MRDRDQSSAHSFLKYYYKRSNLAPKNTWTFTAIFTVEIVDGGKVRNIHAFCVLPSCD